jgi:DNA-binding transcriptional LysR family regulator
MDTNLIYQFRAVFESGTIIKAAEALNMTPGALSRAIKRLEDELDIKLFNPSGRNIVPTKAAQSFYHSSTQIIQSFEIAKTSLKHNDTGLREFKLSTFEVFSTHFISWMVDYEKIDFPITLQEATPGQIEQNILNGLSDFGLTYIPELHADLDHLHIADMILGVFVSKDKKKQSDLSFAVPITELGINHLQAKSLDGWPADIPRKIKYKFEMLESALDLTSRGHSKILCPKFIVQIENERLDHRYQLVEEIQTFKLPKFKVYAIKRKNQIETSEFKKLCKAVRLVMK